MNVGDYPDKGSHEKELSGLLRTLDETQRRIMELTGARLGTESGSLGNPTWLPDAAVRAVQLSAILNALPAHIALLDPEGTIVGVNAAWRRFASANLLASDHFAVGENYIKVAEDARGDCAEEAADAARGIRSVLSGERDHFALEYPCHSPNEQRWFRLMATPLEPGRHEGAVVMHINITERKLAEDALRQSEERYRLLFESNPQPMLVYDLETLQMLAVNNVALADYGYSRDEFLKLTIKDIRPPEDIPALLENVAKVTDGIDRAGIWRHMTKDGRIIQVNIVSHVIEFAGRRAEIVMAQDVTRQMQLEEQLRQSQRLEAVGQLTGGVAHDFNNLLTVILGNADLLGEQLEHEPTQHSLVEMIATAAQRGADLTHQLLAFARRQALDPKAVNVNQLVAGMDRLLRHTLGEHIEIEFVRAAGLWKALVDPAQLENAILNLALNARDAMSGGGKLTIETANMKLDRDYAEQHADVEPGQYVMVAVSDTGTGIPPEHLPHVFEPFYTTKDAGKGTGLGLSMVYGFIKQSQGHVKVYSEPGDGTTIRMYLPRSLRGDAESSTGQGGKDPHFGAETILLVEDDDLVRRYAKRVLESLGYRVLVAEDGQEALRVIRQHSDIDLLFTDVIMPGGMNGRELADAACQIRPKLRVLYTSGYTENAIVHQGRLDEGANLIGKPYRRDELAKRLREVLGDL